MPPRWHPGQPTWLGSASIMDERLVKREGTYREALETGFHGQDVVVLDTVVQPAGGAGTMAQVAENILTVNARHENVAAFRGDVSVPLPLARRRLRTTVAVEGGHRGGKGPRQGSWDGWQEPGCRRHRAVGLGRRGWGRGCRGRGQGVASVLPSRLHYARPSCDGRQGCKHRIY